MKRQDVWYASKGSVIFWSVVMIALFAFIFLEPSPSVFQNDAGYITPDTNSVCDLGTASYPWKDVDGLIEGLVLRLTNDFNTVHVTEDALVDYFVSQVHLRGEFKVIVSRGPTNEYSYYVGKAKEVDGDK